LDIRAPGRDIVDRERTGGIIVDREMTAKGNWGPGAVIRFQG